MIVDLKMSLIKNCLLFGGWIPTLCGGAGAVWWLQSDKTIEDALKRTGLRFLSSKEDFERVYDEFEDDDNIFKDIPDAEQQRGKAISNWCKNTLQKSLVENESNNLILNAIKYCMEGKKVSSGASNFKKFDNILGLLNGTKVETKNMLGLTIALLGGEKNEDIYYGLNNEDDLSKDAWILNNNANKKRVLGTRLFIDKKYEILNSKTAGVSDSLFLERATKYDQETNKENKFSDLESGVYTVDRGDTRGTGVTKTVLLKDHCAKKLKEFFDDTKELEKNRRLFIRWCTENPEV